jgi:hypothetical protein
MVNRSLAVALILGLVSLPLSCGGDDDDTAPSGGKAGKGGSAGKAGGAGKGGSGGKAGATSGGAAGKAGSAGKGGSAGSGGTSGTGTGGSSGHAGTAGGGGTAGGITTGGTGGSMAGGSGESGQGGVGAGAGEGGAGGASDGAAERTALCTAICAKEPTQGEGGGPGTPAACPNNGTCVADVCDPTNPAPSDACLASFTTYLQCLKNAPIADFACGASGELDTSNAAVSDCIDQFGAWLNDCS